MSAMSRRAVDTKTGFERPKLRFVFKISLLGTGLHLHIWVAAWIIDPLVRMANPLVWVINPLPSQ